MSKHQHSQHKGRPAMAVGPVGAPPAPPPVSPAAPAVARGDAPPAAGAGEPEVVPAPVIEVAPKEDAAVAGAGSISVESYDPPKPAAPEFAIEPVIAARAKAYSVVAVDDRGFWRLRRKFTKKPTVIPADELNAAQVAALTAPELKKHLKVELIQL